MSGRHPNRRRSLVTVVMTAVLMTAGCSGISDVESPPKTDHSAIQSPQADARVGNEIGAIEAEFDVTVGAVARGQNGHVVDNGGDSRMPYASTMKAFVAAALLASVPDDERQTVVRWTQSEIDAAGYSPVTSAHLDGGLSVDALAEAAVRESDNTAANLVMNTLGGPSGVQDFLRRIGDTESVVTNYEPDLNDVIPGRSANTSTPMALARNLETIFEGNVLDPDARDTLLDWMSGNATGNALISAAAPSEWTVADKSGGAGGVRNDIAAVTTQSGERIYIAILTITDDPDADYRDEVVERVARILLDEF